jgi:nicotinamidase-related amidase
VVFAVAAGLAALAAAFPPARAAGRAGQRQRRRARAHGDQQPAFTPPPDWTDIVPELDQQPDDLLVTKQTWGAFHRTPLDTLLRDRGVTQIVLTGVATSAGVESTARAAHEHGYHVVLATDAMADRDPGLHENSVRRIFPRLGETATTDDILTMLDKTR